MTEDKPYLTVKDLIALLGKHDPDALVLAFDFDDEMQPAKTAHAAIWEFVGGMRHGGHIISSANEATESDPKLRACVCIEP